LTTAKPSPRPLWSLRAGDHEHDRGVEPAAPVGV